MTLDRPYRLADGVALRAERFGALAYRYDTRRLYFIHSRDAADFVAGLDGSVPLGTAIAGFVARRALPVAMRECLLETTRRLEGIGLVSAGECPR